MSRVIVALLALLVAASVCGCITVTVHSKVDKNGKLADYNITMTMPNLGAGKSKMAKEKVSKDLEWVKKAGGEVKEKYYVTNSTVTFITDIRNVNLSKLSNSSKFKVKIIKNGNYLIYYDYTFTNNKSKSGNLSNEMLASMIKVNYYLEMPGKIVDSNADKVKGNKAEWHFSSRKTPIYAKCELPKSPGFGTVETLLAILAVTGIGLLKRRS